MDSKTIDSRAKELDAREAAVAERERAVTEREKKVAAAEQAAGIKSKRQSAGEPTTMSGEEALKKLYEQNPAVEAQRKKRVSG
jgi:hypothetical protein